MSDYKHFLLETHIFVEALESVAPAESLPIRSQLIIREVREQHLERALADNPPVALVAQIRSLCVGIEQRNITGLMPALERYIGVVDDILSDRSEDIPFQREILGLLWNLTAMRLGAVNERALSGDAVPRGVRKSARRRTLDTNAPIGLMTSRDIRGAKPSVPEPTLRVRLTGPKVKGRAVECDTRCDLAVDWGSADGATIAELVGNELKRAREAKLEVAFVLYRGLFEVVDNKTRIVTRFSEEGFDAPVSFGLIAPKAPAAKSYLYLEMEIQGRPAIRIRIVLTVLEDISSASDGDQTKVAKIDLDKLIASATRSPPEAILRVTSSAPPSAELTIFKTGNVYTSKEDALSQMSIANQLGAIAQRVDNVALDPVWNKLADPLNPSPAELPWLFEPLAKTAAAGSELYEWLAISAGMRDILNRIDALPIGARIIVRSDGVAIPWETLYPLTYRTHQSDGNYAGAVDPAKFWGYRFQFETIMCPGLRDLPEGDTERTEQHRNAERKLTAVMNEDIDLEQTWAAGKPVDLQIEAFNSAVGRELTGIEIKSKCSDARRLLEQGPTLGPFVYFYCHGSATKPFDPNVAVLQLGGECKIAVSDVGYDSTFVDAPIVFLNSCFSGPLASISFDSFCARFLHKGAFGLITTDFGVPAPFAARFGCELILRYMAAKETLGEILLDMRRKALDQHIPIGLFYMLRCPSDVSLNSK